MMLAASRMKKILLGLTAACLFALPAGIIVADWMRDINYSSTVKRAKISRPCGT